ncbi:PREDICTED: protein GPR107 [Rhagoletis zephyria]|uniref:protein GPR107 n=1 Tax=Rhagoletis zephyria TaxID=28612 RepID=UPI00081167DB|nr:PREDICTED: protein GPR107 [Rhagoletis zephyria]XP_017468864.1 PREDICTED: protein GPR107 [Rhagoletis zephyria]XP_017468865.1 PREDICTED: protein GPR107 [Rhagoletis zephyria]
MGSPANYKLLILLVLFLALVAARKHHLEVRHDVRPYIALSTFGFYTDGHLEVHLSKLHIEDVEDNDLYGLTLDKTTIDQLNPYLDSHQNKCILEEPSSMQRSGPILFFIFDLKNLNVKVQCSPEWKNQHIYRSRALFPMYRGKRHSRMSDSTIYLQRRKRSEDAGPAQGDDNDIPLDEQQMLDDDDSVEAPQIIAKPSSPLPVAKAPLPTKAAVAPLLASAEPAKVLSFDPKNVAPPPATAENPFPHESENARPALKAAPAVSYENIPYQLCKNYTIPLARKTINGKAYYNMSFSMLVATLHDEGLYNLHFHACPNYRSSRAISFDVDIEEKNNNNFLSAGEMPLPALYSMMSVLFFLSGLFWVFILKKSKHTVHKLHYIMAVLVFLKSLSLMFHSINYHFIQIRGEHVEAWAILYYVTHLLKGSVLFITIVLMGTGWTFIKPILSDKDKKIFMIVIPLQVLANVAEIIIDESEESDIEFRTWRNIFIFVDLICCGAILFPIVWSIKHLHEASATDGKAAINLRKLKLFRQFYIMIVCYIYFTRIVVYLLKMTVAFQYAWLDEMFHEMATYVFFVLTGYKFRPDSSHPYFAVRNEEDDAVEVLTESGLTEGLHRTKALNRNALPPAGSTLLNGTDEERENLITKRESSHEYD